MDLKKVVPVLKNSGVSTGLVSTTLQNIHQASPNVGDQRLAWIHHLQRARWLCHVLTNSVLTNNVCTKKETPWSFLGQQNLDLAVNQVRPWGLEVKDSIPKSSDPTHIHRSYQSSAITMIPAVASGSSGPCHYPFLFLDSCFSLIKYFFSPQLINSQQHGTQRIPFKGSR